MAGKTQKKKRAATARRSAKTASRPAPATADGNASDVLTGFKLSDGEVERALLSGEHAAALESYFGEQEYAQLQSLARTANARAARGGERVLILPGIMGSKLGFAKDLIWLDPLDIARGNLDELRLTAAGAIRALGVFLFSYLKLKFVLEIAGFDADFFPYDWRRDVVESGATLKDALAKEKSPRIHLVCHSMGGLVARAALRQGAQRVANLVMLGTPNGGSYRATEVLRATFPVLRKLAAVDQRHTAEQLAERIFRYYPSVYQLLPSPQQTEVDLLDTRNWPAGGVRPIESLLENARALHGKLAPPDERFTVIAGVNQETPTGVRSQGDRFIYRVSMDGDGTVPLDLALLADTRTFFVEEAHGSLANHAAVQQAVVDLLRQGHSDALPTTRPAVRGGVQREVDESALRRDYDLPRGQVPSASQARRLLEEVASPRTAAATTGAPAEQTLVLEHVTIGRRRQHRLDITLAQGSLTEVDAQACVLGVFRNVAPDGAARAVDERLGGAITEVFNRRMFSANVGEIFVLPTRRGLLRTEFIIFVGLGPFGRFNDEVLQTIAENVVRTLLRTGVSDFATVLMGSGSGKDPSVSLQNLLAGFFRGLVDSDLRRCLRRVILCEWDAERYLSMKRELFRLSGTPLFEEVEVTIDEEILPEPVQAVRRPAAAVPQPVYLTITAERHTRGVYTFDAALLGTGTKAAVLRGESRVSEADIKSLHRSIASGLTFSGLAEWGARAAELLLGPEIRDALARLRDHPLVLVHDAAASRIPWEAICIDGVFPAKRGGLSRRYLADNLSVAKWLEERRKDKALNMLLIINPTEDLDGAQEEGERIQRLFATNPAVKQVIRCGKAARRSVLLDDMRSGLYDVIHYAGHAYFDELHPGRSGILCSGGDVLSGADLAQLASLPSLVFFNACEAGRIRGRGRDADAGPARERSLQQSLSFAEAFLRGGVANYIGTYWPVNDAAAEAFAGRLYRDLLAGVSVGDALLQARGAVFALKNVDWADYIHYGNHNFTLKECVS